MVLCVDDTSQIQALDRSQPVLPMMPGMPERRTHDYQRNGITSLFAAFNIADGTVIGDLHRRHRATEFKKFLTTIDKTVPQTLDVHVVCDHYGTHKTPAIKARLARHPRFLLHFTPTGSSWINQVERWFGFLTDQMLRRGSTRACRPWRATHRPGRRSLTDLTSASRACPPEPRPARAAGCRRHGPGAAAPPSHPPGSRWQPWPRRSARRPGARPAGA